MSANVSGVAQRNKADSQTITMLIEPIYFDWRSPLLPQVATWLLSEMECVQNCCRGKIVEPQALSTQVDSDSATQIQTKPLSNAQVGSLGLEADRSQPISRHGFKDWLVVLPSRRAGRRLVELLLAGVGRQEVLAEPPRIITVGSLPELLYRSQTPLASDLERQMFWAQALRAVDPELLEKLASHLADRNDTGVWFSAGCYLDQLYDELGGAGIDFHTVADNCSSIGTYNDEERWQILAAIAEQYNHFLIDAGLSDRNRERRIALENQDSWNQWDRIFLVGTVDLPRITCNLLQSGGWHTSLCVYAPQRHAAGFDNYGCLRTEYWSEIPIPIDRTQIEVVAGPSDQAEAALRWLAQGADTEDFDFQKAVIGVGDEEVVPCLEQRLAKLGIGMHYAAGQPIARTRPMIFLQRLEAYLRSWELSDLGALLRNPDVERWLIGTQPEVSDDYLIKWDHYQALHLQVRIGSPPPGGPEEKRLLLGLDKAISDLICGVGRTSRSLSAWAEIIADTLVKLYAGQEDQPGISTVLEALQNELVALYEFGKHCGDSDNQSTMADALGVLRRRLASARVQLDHDRGSLEVLGWLELLLDDSPILVATGLNEGLVPESVNADMFLPDTIRRQLGLLDNNRRFARDVYVLSAVVASHRQFRAIAGRRRGDGTRLLPSRLILTAEPQEVAERVIQFVDVPPRELSFASAFLGEVGSRSPLAVPPRPNNERPPKIVRATAFRDYLQCPYRFYLQHVLGLSELTDEALELDPLAFGSIAHNVFEDFAMSPEVDSTDAKDILRQLQGSLKAWSEQRFGSDTHAAVLLQIEQLSVRLQEFAKWQANRRKAGWEIHSVEVPFGADQLCFETSKGRVGVAGRIDRIDFHPGDQCWAVFDYKVSEKDLRPQDARVGNEWVDLQLPLYALALRRMGYQGPLRLGYIGLSAESGSDLACWADWDQAVLDEAYDVAQSIAEKIATGIFWPPTDKRLVYDRFGGICGSGQFLSSNNEGGVDL